MNIKKSTKVALAMRGENQTWLARQLNKTPAAISGMLNLNNPKRETIDELANVFGMKASKFIALGE